MWVDAHTHLDHYTEEQLPVALAEIDDLGILTLANSMDLGSYLQNMEIAGNSTQIIPGLGVHPMRAAACVDDLERYRPYLADAAFIGEIGLDYHWVEDAGTYPAQRSVCEFFLAAARDLDKLVNLHTKGAEAEIRDLLDRYQVRRAIVHWYSGPLDIFHQLVDLGCAFTIGVELLPSPLIRQIAVEVPLSQLLTETDNPSGLPWLTGETGYPRHVIPVVEELASLRGLSVAALCDAVHTNMAELLRVGRNTSAA